MFSYVKTPSYLSKKTLCIMLSVSFIFCIEYSGIIGDPFLWMRHQFSKRDGNKENFTSAQDRKSPNPALRVNDEMPVPGKRNNGSYARSYNNLTGPTPQPALQVKDETPVPGYGDKENYTRAHNLKSPTLALKMTDEKAVPGSTDRRDKAMLEPLTFHCNNGRMGNQMCTLAVLQGIGALNKRNISILPCNKKKLDPYFQITIPEVHMSTFVERNPYNIKYYLRPEDGKISNETNYITGYRHPCSFTFFDHIRHKIRKTFRFRDKFRLNAEQTLLNIKGNRTNVTFVGVHVRRGDYVRWTPHAWLWAFEGREVDREYFEKATKYFRDKYTNVIFVVVSDDLEWCMKNLTYFGMYVPEKSLGPGYDMAILAQCNHTLLTYGTFGFWGAYLAGGDVVYFDKFLKPGSDFLKEKFRYEKMYLPEWVGIDTTKPGFWNTYVHPTAPTQEKG